MLQAALQAESLALRERGVFIPTLKVPQADREITAKSEERVADTFDTTEDASLDLYPGIIDGERVEEVLS